MTVSLFSCAYDALLPIKSGAKLLIGGFGLCGIPTSLIKALTFKGDVKDLHIVSNTAGTDKHGLGLLISSGKVKKITSSYIGENNLLEREYLAGRIDLELVPQGSLAEKLRMGGAGIPAFYTRTGLNTYAQTGNIEIHHAAHAMLSEPKEIKNFDEHPYILEKAIKGDVALIHACIADRYGNLKFRYSARNFNPIMAQAANHTIAEYEILVDELPSDQIHLPGIFVDSLVSSAAEEKLAEKTVLKNELISKTSETRLKIARRVAQEFKKGMYINLGIGIPTLATHFAPKGIEVTIQSENGILGMGDYPTDLSECDPDIIDAGKETVMLKSGASIVDSADAFGMIRGGHLDLTVLGAFQVSQDGSLANWIIPGKMVKGMGGAMDLISSGRTRVIAAFEHTDRQGNPKIVEKCTLPLTGKSCVNRIITEKAVFDVLPSKRGLSLVQMAENVTLEEIKKSTGCHFEISTCLLEPY